MPSSLTTVIIAKVRKFFFISRGEYFLKYIYRLQIKLRGKFWNISYLFSFSHHGLRYELFSRESPWGGNSVVCQIIDVKLQILLQIFSFNFFGIILIQNLFLRLLQDNTIILFLSPNSFNGKIIVNLAVPSHGFCPTNI